MRVESQCASMIQLYIMRVESQCASMIYSYNYESREPVCFHDIQF